MQEQAKVVSVEKNDAVESHAIFESPERTGERATTQCLIFDIFLTLPPRTQRPLNQNVIPSGITGRLN